MNISINKNFIIRIGTIFANCGYIALIILWSLETKFLDAIFFSPTIFFKIHWDTAWAKDLLLYSIISFIVFFIVGFFLWKLNVKVFGGHKAERIGDSISTP